MTLTWDINMHSPELPRKCEIFIYLFIYLFSHLQNLTQHEQKVLINYKINVTRKPNEA